MSTAKGKLLKKTHEPRRLYGLPATREIELGGEELSCWETSSRSSLWLAGSHASSRGSPFSVKVGSDAREGNAIQAASPDAVLPQREPWNFVITSRYAFGFSYRGCARTRASCQGRSDISTTCSSRAPRHHSHTAPYTFPMDSQRYYSQPTEFASNLFTYLRVDAADSLAYFLRAYTLVENWISN